MHCEHTFVYAQHRTSGDTMDLTAFLESIRRSRHYRGQIVYIHRIPEREAAYGELSRPLPAQIASALSKMGISRLYTHQVEAIEAVRRGESVVIVTGTASGKTLCYNVPVLERLLDSRVSPRSTAFYLFPTKALAQDQLRGLRRYAELEPSLSEVVKAGCYDGDTPPSTRRKLRDEASIILTNPDMLHQGILPYHTRWSKFFMNLRYVVVDEIHTYRGIFGSNVANVIRRLNRICRHYGSSPQFICSSATIANPHDLAERLTGVPMTLIDNDGSPRGEKSFVLWNPPVIDVAGMERRSSNIEAQDLMVALMRNGVRTIAFGRARIVAELMYRYVRESLPSDLAGKVRAYRGGYLPEYRREIERQLFSGELMGITSTNALELGIDIGGLDAAIIIGFPGTVASLWQQAGRAGRSADDSVVFFVGYNDPIDQFLMRHPTYLFGQSPEAAVIDPDNPYILANHMRCSAFELPLKERELDEPCSCPECRGGAEASGSHDIAGITSAIARILADSGQLKEIDRTWYYSSTDFPAKEVNLRTISDNTFTILEIPNGAGDHKVPADCSADNDGPPDPSGSTSTVACPGGRVIGQVDSISAPELVYPGAVYMHEAETYFVEDLDLQNKVAYVRKANVDYYTNAILDASIRITGRQSAGVGQRDIVSRQFSSPSSRHSPSVHYGPAVVTWATTGFKKIKFYSLDSIGYGKVNILPQHLETMAFWLVPPESLVAEIQMQGRNPVEGLMGIRNLAVHVLPLFAMCDKQDIGGIVDSSNTGVPTMFIYDRYAGGLGFAERAYQIAEELMRTCLDVLRECGCEEGCPSCVGLPVLRPPIHTDPDVFGAFPIPDKAAARIMLNAMVG